jgi:formamidase
VAVKGGAQDCPYTYMQDMAAGTYRLPWKVDVTDGSAFGFAAPTRTYQGAEENPVIPDAAPAAPITKAA